MVENKILRYMYLFLNAVHFLGVIEQKKALEIMLASMWILLHFPIFLLQKGTQTNSFKLPVHSEVKEIRTNRQVDKETLH